MGHIGFSDPFDNGLRDVIIRATGDQAVLQGEDIVLHQHGTLVCMGTFPSTFVHVLITICPLLFFELAPA